VADSPEPVRILRVGLDPIADAKGPPYGLPGVTGEVLEPERCRFLFEFKPIMKRTLRILLSGAAVGAAADGIGGGLIGLGSPEIVARRYEGKVKAGNLLISVHTENSGEIAQAKDIFTKAGAQDICTTGEASVKEGPAPERASRQPEPALSGPGV